MLFQFIDNSTPRPGTLCGIDRGDHYGSSAYNAEWSQFLGALDRIWSFDIGTSDLAAKVSQLDQPMRESF